MIKRDSVRSQWSELIAEALGVRHRWLQSGEPPLLPQGEDGMPCAFPERFKLARAQRGLSQEDVAAIMEVSRVAVSHYEAGKNHPQLSALIAFCQETGVSMEWLVLGRSPTVAHEQRVHVEDVGARLLMLRRERPGMSVAALAKAIGVTASALSQWETGATKYIRPQHLLAAAMAFEVSLVWLITGTGPRKTEEAQTETEAKALTAFRKLSAPGQDAALAHLQWMVGFGQAQ